MIVRVGHCSRSQFLGGIGPYLHTLALHIRQVAYKARRKIKEQNDNDNRGYQESPFAVATYFIYISHRNKYLYTAKLSKRRVNTKSNAKSG